MNIIFFTPTLFCPAFANSQNIVLVRLFEAYRPISHLEIFPPFDLLLPDRTITIDIPVKVNVEAGQIRMSKIFPTKNTKDKNSPFIISHRLSIRGHNSMTLHVTEFKSRRQYHGSVLLSVAKNDSLEIINKVPLFNYIEDVVASEAPIKAPLEMLKAQAILVQTILSLSSGNGIIGDSTQSQCYLGASLENEKIADAVKSVLGKKLYYKNTPIIAYYHSTCAGGTSDGAQFFHLTQRHLPYLKGVTCRYCQKSPFWKTTSTQIPREQFIKVFGRGMPEIITQDNADRPLALKLSNGEIISGYDFWMRLGQNFGWDKAPGTRFKLSVGKSGDYIIESTGAGHGVGLCQWGACGLAEQGKSYPEILQYFFPGCKIY